MKILDDWCLICIHVCVKEEGDNSEGGGGVYIGNLNDVGVSPWNYTPCIWESFGAKQMYTNYSRLENGLMYFYQASQLSVFNASITKILCIYYALNMPL